MVWALAVYFRNHWFPFAVFRNRTALEAFVDARDVDSRPAALLFAVAPVRARALIHLRDRLTVRVYRCSASVDRGLAWSSRELMAERVPPAVGVP